MVVESDVGSKIGTPIPLGSHAHKFTLKTPIRFSEKALLDKKWRPRAATVK